MALHSTKAKSLLLLIALFFGYFVSAGVVSVDAQETDSKPKDDQYLQASIKIANWLQSVKIENRDGTCTWPDIPDESRRSTIELYHGDSGVVLFYIKLYQATKNGKYLAEAEQGARALIKTINTPLKRQPGLYTGYSGYGSVLLKLWQITKKDTYRKHALKCVQILDKSKSKRKAGGGGLGSSTDVISGNAGIGQFLVDVYEVLGDAAALKLATEIGDGLISDALKGSDPKHRDGKAKGLRWKVSKTFPREYPNYSHGTAGNADFLVRLHTVLAQKARKQGRDPDDRFLKAAEQGAEYLKSVAKIENGTCLIFHNTDQGDKLFYLGWCHGPAGTGNFFWNLYEATDKKSYKELTTQSAQAIIKAQLYKNRTAGFWNNTGQCCGSAGVAEFMLKMYQRTKEKRYLDECKRLSRDILERASTVKIEETGKQGLKWILAEHRIDPKGLKAHTGYMQGASGIGCWLLEMHAATKK